MGNLETDVQMVGIGSRIMMDYFKRIDADRRVLMRSGPKRVGKRIVRSIIPHMLEAQNYDTQSPSPEFLHQEDTTQNALPIRPMLTYIKYSGVDA